MEITRMSLGIIKIINKVYSDYLDDDDCLDIIYIKDICNMYKKKNIAQNSVTLSEINISSPNFKKVSINKSNNKTNKKTKTTHKTIMNSTEFVKKYAYFIRIIYACLKIEVELFDVNENILTLKNNYQLMKALELKKKKLLVEHIMILKNQYKNISQKITPEYETFYETYVMKIKIIDKILGSILKLIKYGIFKKTDNLLSLLLPYFYKYTEYIEEYN